MDIGESWDEDEAETDRLGNCNKASGDDVHSDSSFTELAKECCPPWANTWFIEVEEKNTKGAKSKNLI